MKLSTDSSEKKQDVSSTTIPIQTIVPVMPHADASAKWRLTLIIGVLQLCLMCMLTVFIVSYSMRSGSSMDGEEVYLEEQLLMHSRNFDVRIDIDGEKCIESIHTDENQNLVTFHYIGENGREGGMAVYDYNQGLVAMRDSNETFCLFAKLYDLPDIQVGDLQLSARNKQVIEIEQEIVMSVKGLIPDGFLEMSGGPIFGDLCRGLPSYWLETTKDADSAERDRRSGGLTIHVTVPAGSTAAVIVLDGASTGGTFVISIPKN